MDEIRIDDLEVFAYHGVLKEENEKGQPFFVNLVLHVDTREAGKTDDLSKSINYAEVAEFCTKFMKKEIYQLIETVAEKMAEGLLLTFPLLKSLELEIRKPYAPVGYPLKSVSVKIQRGWHEVYLAVGSNMGDKMKYIEDAFSAISAHSLIKEARMSQLIVTKPYGYVEQDDFVNGAISIKTIMPPEELLDFLHTIEQNANRERILHWGPRTLDLDIIFYDHLIYESEKLVIPHIDMQNRNFVLAPMCELAPNFRHPIFQKTMKELQAELEKRE